ncbi:tatD [Mytilus coruscus]|uniref:TatD n=1 Tax=Mytilus coruscus TaxID=42192 RepID=A0A6J8CT67_MYTCO|nr:tatD [Mytilus coruscus]
MASIERELEYDVGEEIELERNRTVVIMGKEMEVLDEMIEEDPKAPQCPLCQFKARHQTRIGETPSLQERRLEYHGKEHHRAEECFLWDENVYGESWVQLMNGLFRALAEVKKVEYPEGLMEYVSEIMAGVKTNRNFTEQELSLVRLFNRLNDYPVLQGKKLKSKSVYGLHSLIHWKVLVIVISKLQSDQQHWLKTFEEYKSATGISLGPLGSKLSGPTSIADSHFHLDTLLSSRTFAIGECGLDTSDRNVNLSKQIEYLEKQLQLAVKNSLPVVIHCRGNDSLHLTLLTSLVNCCPKEQKIHWHCFTSSQEIYLTASRHFINLVFGITPFNFGNRYPNIRDIIKENGIDRLVLESDAPYIQYKENQIQNPYIVNFVAEEISKLLNISVEQVFEITFSNTQKIYGKRD